MPKKAITTPKAKAIGPYSAAVESGDLIFVSGQIPLDSATGKLVGGDIAAQTKQSLENLKTILTAAGLTFAHVVKTTIFLASMDDFATVNRVYGERFPFDPPARSTVQAARLPRDVKVEIDAIAVI